MHCLGSHCLSLCNISQEEMITFNSIFQPPLDPQYTISPSSSEEDCAEISLHHSSYNLLFLSQYIWIKTSSYLLKKENRNSIVILYLKNTNKPSSQGVTILFSHGHRSSIGMLYSFFFDLSTQLKCDVVAYDYCGFGHSTGTASESEIKSDITEVYSFIHRMSPNEDVVLFGHAIGSIPSVYLASKANEILGMILMSPIASGDKVLKKPSSIDNYEEEDLMINNISKPFYVLNKLSKITNPTFLIHGMMDKIVEQHHSAEISKRLVEATQWYPKNGDHFNIVEAYRDKFYSKIVDFIFLLKKFREMQVRKNSKFTFQEAEGKEGKSSINDSLSFSEDDKSNSWVNGKIQHMMI